MNRLEFQRRSAGVARAGLTAPCVILPVAAVLVLQPAAVAGGKTRALIVPSAGTPLHIAVSVPDDIELDAGTNWELVEKGRRGGGIPAELIVQKNADGAVVKKGRKLAAVIPPREGDATRRFLLRPRNEAGREAFRFEPVSDLSLGLRDGERPVLVYNHGVMSHPKVPERYSRSNYFHPVYGIDGEVLTDDFLKKDHLHHRGLFWAWTHVQAGGRRSDFWHMPSPGGSSCYRFERWTCRHAGSLVAALGVRTGWHAGGRKIVREEMQVFVYPVDGDSRVIDIELVWTALEVPVTLKGAAGKGYGGLTFRFAPRKETVITAPGGRTTKDLVAARLPWADLSGRFGGAERPSGAAVFISPDHPDYPPMWLTRHYGPLCVGWPGLKPGTLRPGKPLRCRYRVWIHRGNPEADVIQAAYEAYRKGGEAKWGER